MLFPDFEEYFELITHLAGNEGPGGKISPFDKYWIKMFMTGHERRKLMRTKNNEALLHQVKGKQERARL